MLQILVVVIVCHKALLSLKLEILNMLVVVIKSLVNITTLIGQRQYMKPIGHLTNAWLKLLSEPQANVFHISTMKQLTHLFHVIGHERAPFKVQKVNN